MQRLLRCGAAFLCVLAAGATAALSLSPGAFAGAPGRSGPGGAGAAAAPARAVAVLPVARRPLAERPGFGDPVAFLPGDPADSLYPPGWVAGGRVIAASGQ